MSTKKKFETHLKYVCCFRIVLFYYVFDDFMNCIGCSFPRSSSLSTHAHVVVVSTTDFSLNRHTSASTVYSYEAFYSTNMAKSTFTRNLNHMFYVSLLFRNFRNRNRCGVCRTRSITFNIRHSICWHRPLTKKEKKTSHKKKNEFKSVASVPTLFGTMFSSWFCIYLYFSKRRQ